MLWEVFLLMLDIACIVLAVLSLMFMVVVFAERHDRESYDDEESYAADEKFRKLLPKFRLGIAGIFIGSATMGYQLFTYLTANEPHLMVVFAVWYIVGFASRFVLLISRHELFSPIFANNDTEYVPLFFWAIGGPLVTAHLIYQLLWGKHPLHWL